MSEHTKSLISSGFAKFRESPLPGFSGKFPLPLYVIALVVLAPWIAGVSFLVSVYGLTDDYSMLMIAVENPGEMTREISTGGRFLYGPLRELSAALVEVPERLVWLRMLSLAGLSCLSLTLLKILLLSNWGLAPATVCSIVIIASPSASVLGGWATCWPYPWAAFFAILGFLTAQCSLGAFQKGEKFQPFAWIVFSSLLIITSALIYQPAPFFYLVPLLGLLLGVQEANRSVFILAVFHITFLSAILFGVYLIMKFGLSISGLDSNSRVAFTNNPLGKLEWFLTSLLPNSVNFLTLRGHRGEHSLLYIFTGCAVLLPIIRYYFKVIIHQDASHSLRMLLVSGLIFLMIYSLPLVINESYASYRLVFASASFWVMLFTWSVFSLTEYLSRRVRTSIIVIFATIALGLSFYRNSFLIAIPQATEYRLVSNAFQQLPNDISAAEIVIIQPTFEHSLAPIVTTNEFGMPSTMTEWAVQGIFWHVRRSRHLPTEIPPPLNFHRDANATHIISRANVVDLGRVLQRR